MKVLKCRNDWIFVETGAFSAGNVQFFVDFYEFQLKCQAVFMDESPFSGIFALVAGC